MKIGGRFEEGRVGVFFVSRCGAWFFFLFFFLSFCVVLGCFSLVSTLFGFVSFGLFLGVGKEGWFGVSCCFLTRKLSLRWEFLGFSLVCKALQLISTSSLSKERLLLLMGMCGFIEVVMGVVLSFVKIFQLISIFFFSLSCFVFCFCFCFFY